MSKDITLKILDLVMVGSRSHDLAKILDSQFRDNQLSANYFILTI